MSVVVKKNFLNICHLARASFSKRTAKIRYGIIFSIMKYSTPSLYKKLVAKFYVGRTPRPSTKFMKKYFDNRPLVGAEVGVNIGENAFSLLNKLNIRRLYLVDSYEIQDVRREAIKRVGRYGKKIQFIVKKSVDASKDIKESLDFVYIDADHKYDSVYQDLEVWYPLVRDGGVVCGHDVFNIKDVLDAVKDWCVNNGILFNVEPPDWYFIKGEKNIAPHKGVVVRR